MTRQVFILNSLPISANPFYVYYLRTDGKYYGWDSVNNRFYNLSTPNIDDLVGINFEDLQDGDVLSYDSATQTWINKVIDVSGGVTSFNERTGDIILLDSDVTTALEYTPEDVANKTFEIIPELINDTQYPTTSAVFNFVTNLGYITASYLTGYATESWVTGLGYITSSALTGYATETYVTTRGYITNVVTALGYTPENTSNKSTSITGNETSNTLFPTIKSVVDWVTSLFIKRGTNTTSYVQKTTSTGVIGDSSIFDNGTFVGIGTTSDTGNGKLQISGNLAIRNSQPRINLVSSPGSGGIFFWNDGSNRFAMGYQPIQGSEATGSLNLYSYGASQTILSILANGKILMGANNSSVTSARLEVVSTSQGFLPPKMTNAQKNAIVSPVSGLIVFDTTLNKLCVRGASSWETITSL